ncbi:MAG: restriction endonuclease subunit S [Chloroflexi bacterium]|nr:restriction endonuclease subunit S [Chloroflexota bacterium]
MVDDSATYKRCRVQLNGQGVVLRDIVQGADINTKSQQVCRTGDFIVAEIDAKLGGLGIIPDDLDGAIVSSHYFLFDVDQRVLDRRFLSFFIRTPQLMSQVRAKGSTNYAAIRPADILAYTIPLPPIDEQRRIVARLEELATKVAEIRTLQREMSADARDLLLSVYARIVDGAEWLPMSAVAPLVRRPVEVEPDQEYCEVGIRSFGKGTFHKPPATGASLGAKRVFRIEERDLLFNIVFAWEGAVAVAGPDDHGRIGSHRFLTCVPNRDLGTPTFLKFHFLSDTGLGQLGQASPGGAGRNRTLGLDALQRIAVPIPTLEKQLWFQGIHQQVEAVNGIHDPAAARLDAVLASILDRAFKGEL